MPSQRLYTDSTLLVACTRTSGTGRLKPPPGQSSSSPSSTFVAMIDPSAWRLPVTSTSTSFLIAEQEPSSNFVAVFVSCPAVHRERQVRTGTRGEIRHLSLRLHVLRLDFRVVAIERHGDIDVVPGVDAVTVAFVPEPVNRIRTVPAGTFVNVNSPLPSTVHGLLHEVRSPCSVQSACRGRISILSSSLYVAETV